jgi:hypothetical protein
LIVAVAVQAVDVVIVGVESFTEAIAAARQSQNLLLWKRDGAAVAVAVAVAVAAIIRALLIFTIA